MKLSVITSYANRMDQFKNFVKFIGNADREQIEFIVVSWNDDNGELINLCQEHNIKLEVIVTNSVFQTAVCHNKAVEKAQGEWILKQDVDCFTYPDFYNELIRYLDENDPNYLIIGARYLKRADEFSDPDTEARVITREGVGQISNARLENLWNCGNEYVVRKKDYQKLAGENEEYLGYSSEDYDFLYRLAKYYGDAPNMAFNNDNPKMLVREQIVKPANKKIFDDAGFLFLHAYHERNNVDGYRDYIQDNKKLLAKTLALT